MAEELNRSLQMLADRGTPKGATAVLDAAHRNVEANPGRAAALWRSRDPEERAVRRDSGPARSLLAFGAAALTVLIVVGGWALLMSDRPEGVEEVSVPTTVPETVSPTTIPETVSPTTVPVTTTVPEATTVPPPAAASPITWLEPEWIRVPDETGVFGGDGAQYLEGIAVGGPGFVAVGADTGGQTLPGEDDTWDAAVWVSDDAVAWTRLPHDEAVFGGPGAQDMLDVARFGDGFVAVGVVDYAYFGGRRSPQETRPNNYGEGVIGVDGRDDIDAAVWVSSDGLSWSRVPDPDGVFSMRDDGSSDDAGDEGMEAVAVGNGLIVAVGSAHGDAAVWVSTDGVSWERVPHDDGVFGGPSGQWMHDVTYSGTGFVAVGTDLNQAETGGGIMRAAVWVSDDGLEWSRVPNTEDLGGEPGDMDAVPMFMWAVTATDSGFVAAGTTPTLMAVWASEDGVAWTRVFDETAPFAYPHTDVIEFENRSRLRHAPIRALAAVGDDVIAVGWDRDAAFMHTPATEWRFHPDLVPGQLGTEISKNDVIVVNGTAIAVGYADGDAVVWIATINN